MNLYPSTINDNSLADIESKVNWTSREGVHTDTSLVMVNFWRDLLPEAGFDALMGAREGDSHTFRFTPGQLAPEYHEDNQYRIRRADFNDALSRPAYGRFYPKGILKNLPNVFPQNVTPTEMKENPQLNDHVVHDLIKIRACRLTTTHLTR